MRRGSATVHVMVQAAQKAARNLVRDFGEIEQLQVSRKGPGDFVSAADRRAEQVIRRELQKARPTFGFLMEESGTIAGEDERRRWIVDPLDGTTNFLHGLPHFCISIALEENDEIIAGVIYDPLKDELFAAEKGVGAFMNDRRIRVSSRSDPALALVGTGIAGPSRAPDESNYLAQLDAVAVRVAGVRRMGAAALDLAYVAAGRLDGFWEFGLKPWDLAAGIAILREAGGRVGRLEGEPLFARGTFYAGNPTIFTQLDALLREASAAKTESRHAQV